MFSVINGLSAVNEPELIMGVQLSSVVPGHMLKYILTITLKETKMHTMLKKTTVLQTKGYVCDINTSDSLCQRQ